MSDEDRAKEYRLEVKRRLFGPYRVRFYPIIAPQICEESTKTQNDLWLDEDLNYSETCLMSGL